jgi:hypothetical protein
MNIVSGVFKVAGFLIALWAILLLWSVITMRRK